MKKIGIIGAMEEEVKRLKDHMEDVNINCIASMNFYEGSLKGSPLVVVRSGIGKVNAAICTQILVDRYEVDLVINNMEDAEEFVKKMNTSKSKLLKELTSDYHYHTIAAPSEKVLNLIKQELLSQGFLCEEN